MHTSKVIVAGALALGALACSSRSGDGSHALTQAASNAATLTGSSASGPAAPAAPAANSGLTAPSTNAPPPAAPRAGGGHDAPINGDVKPPSTGNELPAERVDMARADARALVDLAVERVGQDERQCAVVVDKLAAALPLAFPDGFDEDAVPGLGVLGKCATATARWRAAISAGFTLLDLAPDAKLPARIVRAIAELGEYQRAIETGQALAKEFPASAPMVSAALSFVYCRAEQYDLCEQAADRALTALSRAHVPPTDDSVLINRVLRATARVVTGKAKDAVRELAAIEHATPQMPAAVARVKAQARTTAERGYYIEAVPLQQLPLGVYHLMGKKDTGALVAMKLREHTGHARTFRIETEVPGVTERSSNAITLPARGQQALWIAPPLKMAFDPAVVRSPRPAQLALRVIEQARGGDRVIYDETLPIEVLPRDYLPLRRKVGADSMVPTYGYMGAWVVSNDKAVEAFITEAKARAPGHAFVGEQDATGPQVKALYDALKARGVSYVMDPEVTSTAHFVQRTRLPGEVLASTNAQCLEGTLLFATLMEAIGLRPIIVLVPGHAFVGWHTVDADGTKGTPVFVETTLVGTEATFEQAVQVANRRVAAELKAGAFKSGASTFIDLAELRRAGFSPQPM